MPQLSYGVGSRTVPRFTSVRRGNCSAPLPGYRRFWTLTEGQQRMFTHVMVGANDLAASKKFYDAVLGAIGLPAGQADLKGRIFYRTKTSSFGITRPIDGKAATHANGGTIGFPCTGPDQAKAFHDAGVAHGGKSYLAYLRDPFGNKIVAVHRPPA